MTTERLGKFQLGNFMKTKIAILISAFSFQLSAFSQQPEQNDKPLQTTPQSRGGTIATQIIGQSNQFVQSIRNAFEKGLPAQGENPAVSPKEIKDALGSENVAKLEAALQALSGQSSPKKK
jgi:hypothetical protein